MKLIQRVKIKNESGLHMRPATAITKLLQDSRSHVFFTYNGETINARSIMSILMLVVQKNHEIEIVVEGEDAKETMKGLLKIFEKGCGEKL